MKNAHASDSSRHFTLTSPFFHRRVRSTSLHFVLPVRSIEWANWRKDRTSSIFNDFQRFYSRFVCANRTYFICKRVTSSFVEASSGPNVIGRALDGLNVTLFSLFESDEILPTAGIKSKTKRKIFCFRFQFGFPNEPGRIRPTKCSVTRRIALSKAKRTWGGRLLFVARTLFVALMKK